MSSRLPAMLCYAMLCYAMLCYATQCNADLFSVSFFLSPSLPNAKIKLTFKCGSKIFFANERAKERDWNIFYEGQPTAK